MGVGVHVNKFTSQVSNIQLPMLVPRRGKGYVEVLANCSVSTGVAFDAFLFVQQLLPYANKTFLPESSIQVVDSLRSELKLASVSFTMKFTYSISRVSPTFQETSFELPCFYTATATEKTKTFYLGIELPIQIKDMFSLFGRVEYSIQDSTGIFFEDLLDHAQRYAGIILHPPVTPEDRQQLKTIMDGGKSSYEYLTLLKDSSIRKNFGSGGRAVVYSNDVYNMYKLEYSLTW